VTDAFRKLDKNAKTSQQQQNGYGKMIEKTPIWPNLKYMYVLETDDGALGCAEIPTTDTSQLSLVAYTTRRIAASWAEAIELLNDFHPLQISSHEVMLIAAKYLSDRKHGQDAPNHFALCYSEYNNEYMKVIVATFEMYAAKMGLIFPGGTGEILDGLWSQNDGK